MQIDQAGPAVGQVLACLQLIRRGGSAGGLAVLGHLFGLLAVWAAALSACLRWLSGEVPSIVSVGPPTYVYLPPRESLGVCRFGLTGGFTATNSRP